MNFGFLLQKFNDSLQKISYSVRRTEKALKGLASQSKQILCLAEIFDLSLCKVKTENVKLETTQGTVNFP